MLTIEQMREDILPLLKEKYGKGIVPKPVSAATVESEGFLLEGHAKAIQKLCEADGLIVSFREAGKATLDRIKAGNPCKGHTVMDKSIKKIGDGWTYEVPQNVKIDLDKYKGVIGYPESEGSRIIKGLWRVLDDKCFFDERFPGEIDDTYLTGDYDLHDLLCKNTGSSKWPYARIVSDTVDERSTLDNLNRAILSTEGAGSRAVKVKGFVDKSKKNRMTQSPYSLIRHGAQTSFMSYLHGEVGAKELKRYLQANSNDTNHLPWENAVMNISKSICVFDDSKGIYILKGIDQIYAYYREKNLLNCIPFYYFFKDLKEKGYTDKIEGYANIINRYLRNFVNNLD